MIARAIALFACASLGACTLLVGDQERQDFAVPEDAGVPMDLASDLSRNFVWTTTQWNTQQNLNGVWAGSDDGGTAVYAVGAGSTLLFSSDEGDSWTAITPPLADDFTAVWGRSTSDVYIGGVPVPSMASPSGDWFILRGNVSAGFTRDAFNLDGTAAYGVTSIWSAGPGHTVLASGACNAFGSDGTGVWNLWGGGCNATKLWGTASDDVWLLDDPLVTHTIMDAPFTFGEIGDDFVSANGRQGLWGFGTPGTTQSLWVAGDSTTIETHAAGQTGWTVDHTEDGGVSLYSLWGDSETNLYAVGDESHILHRTATGWVVEQVSGGSDMGLPQIAIKGVFGLPDGRAFAVGTFGWIFVRKPVP